MPVPVAAAPRRDPLRVAALVITIGLHVGVFGVLLVQRVLANRRPTLGSEHFVDATLVRFGKPRDLSFLPHKRGVVKTKAPEEAIKVARDLNALPKLEKKEKPDQIDPLKRTHADQFKHLDDQPEGVETQEGSLTGSRAGTAAEASGDPYIISLMDTIGSAWTVPTTIDPARLATLNADVCMTVSDSGQLLHYSIVRSSGNSQFDSSLEAALGKLRTVPPPPDRNYQGGTTNLRSAARRGRLCPTLTAPTK